MNHSQTRSRTKEPDQFERYYTWAVKAGVVLLIALGTLYASGFIMDSIGRTVTAYKGLRTAIKQ